MARSGTIEGSILNGNYKLRISWTATQNVSANTSTITAKLYLVQSASYTLNIGTRSSSYNSCTIAGVKQTFSTPAINNNGGATTLLGTVSQTVAHNADGTKSLTISGVFGIRATISGTWYDQITASGTVALDTILRGSSVSTGAASVAIGQTLQINVSRLASAHTHYLYYTLGAQSGTIATGVTTAYAWALPMALCNALPSSTSGNLTIYCDTYNGSTYIDTSSVRVTVTVPASVVPSVTGCTISEAADGIPDGWGVYLSGLSQLAISATAAGVYGSTIASYQITVNGATYASNQFTTGILTGSGTKTVSVTCTDTRGRKATKAFNYTVTEYYRPMLGGFGVRRVDGYGTESDEGTYASVNVTANIADVNGNNSGTLTLAYRAKSDSNWTTIGTYAVSGVYDVSETISGINTDVSYDVSVTLTDALYTSSVSAEIETATPTMDFKANGQGIAFGKVSEYDAFECAMPAIFTGGIRSGGNAISPLVAMTVNRNNANQNITAANTYEQINFTGATALGSGLEMDDNGGIVIGSGVWMVRISGQICFGAQTNGMKVAAVWTDGSSTHLARTQAYVTTANPQTINLAPKYVNVSPGSVLSLRVYGAAGDVVYGGTMQTYFTVEAVG